MKRDYTWINTIILVIVVVVVAYPGMALAEIPGTLQLDLSQPPQGEVKDDDPILEKYNEVMREIAISGEAAEVVENIKNTVEGVKSITMDVDVTEIRGKRIERAFVHLLASMEHKIARVEILEPSAIRGQILVADQERMEVRVYSPVNNQVVVRGLEDASKEVLSTLSVADLNTFFDFSEYTVEVLEIVETEGISTYLLQVEAVDEVLQVRVNSDTWFPHEICVVQGDSPGTMVISNVVFDPELTAEELSNLPRAKEVRM